MKKRNKHIALFFSFLIAVGFVASGYHYHTHRYLSDDSSCEARITSGIDNCLFCEGVFSYDIAEPDSETDLTSHPEPIAVKPVSGISAAHAQLPDYRAPPSM